MARILIVDDFKTQRSFLINIVQENGFHFLTATNGKEAIELLTIESVDLILTDLEMPIMDGMEMLKQVKQSSKLKSIPVIMISSNLEMKAAAENAGLFAFVHKPFDRKQLIKHIHHALGESNVVNQYRVLLVDDVSIQTDIWEKVLEMPTFTYEKAHNAQEALNKLRSNTFHAILTDYMMPNVDGERFIRKIKQMSEFKDIPVFVITSKNEIVENGMLGAERVFQKPFNPSVLKQYLLEAVKKK